jgi:hypothetical protein
MVDTDDRFAGGIQIPQHLDDCALCGGINSCERLVQHEKVGVLRQSSGKEDSLLLTA